MCDTVVALPDATADGSVILAKNSDRDPNEAHELLVVPRKEHEVGSTVRCTYVEIPQVAVTNAVLLARPFWIWGAEMGANEHGVAIGNEAVYTKVPYGTEPGLIGMDFLRLGLERADTARAAIGVITGLLEAHGQSGSCRYQGDQFYHNSFLIADPTEAWVLETAGREWAAKRFASGVRTISNAITIGRDWDLASAGLVSNAVERGWCSSREDFDFGRCYSDQQQTALADGVSRQCRSTAVLEARRGSITAQSMMSLLRDHGPDRPPDWAPDHDASGRTLCMHTGGSTAQRGQSTGSMVSHLSASRPTHWLTGTSAPCTGVFKPVWLDAGLPDLGPRPTNRYSAGSLWWRHELLHRSVLLDYAHRVGASAADRDALEARFAEAAGSAGVSPAERLALTERCFAEAEEARRGWLERLNAELPGRRLDPTYARVWRGANEAAGIADLVA